MELPQLIFHAGVNIFPVLLEQKANSSIEEKVACRSRSICLFLQPPASHPHSCIDGNNVSWAFWYITVSFSKMECCCYCYYYLCYLESQTMSHSKGTGQWMGQL